MKQLKFFPMIVGAFFLLLVGTIQAQNGNGNHNVVVTGEEAWITSPETAVLELRIAGPGVTQAINSHSLTVFGEVVRGGSVTQSGGQGVAVQVVNSHSAILTFEVPVNENVGNQEKRWWKYTFGPGSQQPRKMRLGQLDGASVTSVGL